MGCCSAIPETIINTEETFKKIKQIAKGTFGYIFLIKSNKTKIEYALKAIKTKNLEQVQIDAAMREVNNLKILDHPNIISFKCSFFSNIKTSLLNIITEYADNGDLKFLNY